MRCSFGMPNHFGGLRRHWPTRCHSQSGLGVTVWRPDSALNVYLLYIYVGFISLLLCLVCIIKSWFALVLIIYFYIISWIRYYSLCVIFYFQEIMWERWFYRNLWENGGQRTMLKCLSRCSWGAWIVIYHDWKLQIRKEIKEAESEKEKSNLSTD